MRLSEFLISDNYFVNFATNFSSCLLCLHSVHFLCTQACNSSSHTGTGHLVSWQKFWGNALNELFLSHQIQYRSIKLTPFMIRKLYLNLNETKVQENSAWVKQCPVCLCDVSMQIFGDLSCVCVSLKRKISCLSSLLEWIL